MKPAKTICSFPGCMRICDGGRCQQHKKQQHRSTSKNRSGDPFYSSKAWQSVRQAILLDRPLCECADCVRSGAVTPADVVDHIVPRREAPHLELEPSNLRPMSSRHHNRHTARQRKYK